MTATCDKPIHNEKGGILNDLPVGRCALPKDHSGECKPLKDLVKIEGSTLPLCPFDSQHSGE